MCSNIDKKSNIDAIFDTDKLTFAGRRKGEGIKYDLNPKISKVAVMERKYYSFWLP